jgi:hypothetical protein
VLPGNVNKNTECVQQKRKKQEKNPKIQNMKITPIQVPSLSMPCAVFENESLRQNAIVIIPAVISMLEIQKLERYAISLEPTSSCLTLRRLGRR